MPYNEEELHYLDSLINLYTTIGYPCFKVSARKGEGIDTIEKELKGRITLFSGTFRSREIDTHQGNTARYRD